MSKRTIPERATCACGKICTCTDDAKAEREREAQEKMEMEKAKTNQKVNNLTKNPTNLKEESKIKEQKNKIFKKTMKLVTNMKDYIAKIYDINVRKYKQENTPNLVLLKKNIDKKIQNFKTNFILNEYYDTSYITFLDNNVIHKME